MTRETKIGLVIAGSFLCLVSIVVASKMRRNDVPPLDSEESSPTIAANQHGESNQAKEIKHKPDSSPSLPPAKHKPEYDQTISPLAQKPLPSSPPLNAMAQKAADPAPSKVEEELKRLRSENSGQQMPAGKAEDATPKVIVPGNVPPLLPDSKEKQAAPALVPPPTLNPNVPMALPSFPSLGEEETRNKSVVVPGPAKELPGLTPSPLGRVPPAGEKKDSLGPVGPLPPPPETKKEAGKPDVENPFPPVLAPKEVSVPAPAFGGQGDFPPLLKKEEKKNPPALSSEGFGQVKISDAPASGPISSPVFNNSAQEAPKPGFPQDVPALSQLPKEIVREAPKIGFPSEGSPMNPLKEDPKIGFAPAPFNAPPTIPPVVKQNDSPPQNPMFPPPSTPIRSEVPSPNPVPTIAGKEIPSLPPIRTMPENSAKPLAMIPPINVGSTRPAALVQQTDTDLYVVRQGETNFAAVSQRLYGTDKYADALYAYNLDHRMALPNSASFSASLAAGQQVLSPPRGLLERDYRAKIRDLDPNPISPVVNNTPPVRLATPAPLNGVTPAPKLAMIPPQNPPVPSSPTSDRTQSYVVQNPRGESILDIAERVLGDRSRWHEIYRVNPTYRPELSIPPGTSLRMPVN